MKTELVPLTYRHLQEMGETDQWQNRMRLGGIAFALLADGKPVAAGGIVRLWGKVGKVWTIQTEEAKRSCFLMRRIHKHAKEQFPLIRAAMGLERVEGETKADEPSHCRWAERFNFKEEGVMRKYRMGQDYIRYAWTS